ncbi:MAG: hypothetical protein WC436_04635 [Candidatus Babeliales bacterium]
MKTFFKYSLVAICLFSFMQCMCAREELDFLFFSPVPVQQEDGKIYLLAGINVKVEAGNDINIVKDKIRQKIHSKNLKVTDLPDFDLFFMGTKLENKPDWENIKNTHKYITIKFIAPMPQYPQIGSIAPRLINYLISNFENLPDQDNMNQLDLIISSIPKNASTNKAINLISELKAEWKNLSTEEKRNRLIDIMIPLLERK